MKSVKFGWEDAISARDGEGEAAAWQRQTLDQQVLTYLMVGRAWALPVMDKV
jgi:hypothetical protein